MLTSLSCRTGFLDRTIRQESLIIQNLGREKAVCVSLCVYVCVCYTLYIKHIHIYMLYLIMIRRILTSSDLRFPFHSKVCARNFRLLLPLQIQPLEHHESLGDKEDASQYLHYSVIKDWC